MAGTSIEEDEKVKNSIEGLGCDRLEIINWYGRDGLLKDCIEKTA